MNYLRFLSFILIAFGFMPSSAIASYQNTSADFTAAKWQAVPETGSEPIYIDTNSIKLDESQSVITFDLLAPDGSYGRIETDCINNKQRSIRQGSFESKTKATFVSLPNAIWQNIETDSLQATISGYVCSLGDRIEPATDEAFYNAQVQQLEEMTEGCQEKKKTQGNITYQICTINGKPVQASEALTEAGDGLGFWFQNNKVRAIRFFHNGDLAIFDENGRLQVRFYDGNEMQTDFTETERKELEATAKNGYRDIFAVFKI
ncbi:MULTISPECIES: hypothetical protein [Aerosakkonema]|uniref:hypothetical protein n=1 Tax=Aerosakkonema TaxID=1246629 RepID=UPI0035B965F4